MQPFRTLNFSGDIDRDGDKSTERNPCWYNKHNLEKCDCCLVDPQVGSELPATLDRECHTYTPRLHLEGVGDVTRLKIIYAFGEVGGGCKRANYNWEVFFSKIFCLCTPFSLLTAVSSTLFLMI